MNLKILGSGDAVGGIYENITIMGSGDIKGDVECVSYKVLGSGDLHGNLKACFVKINGSGDINGNVDAEEVVINGSGDIEGDIICKSFRINGSGDVKGNVSADEVVLRGAAEINGNCESERFSGKGSFEIHELLNAGEVDIEVIADCNIKEIGAEKISVREGCFKKKGFFKSVFITSNSMGEFKSSVIEGDEIYLENTTADFVRGTNVIIGPKCKIGTVEYMNNFEVNPNSTVKNSIHVETKSNNSLIKK